MSLALTFQFSIACFYDDADIMESNGECAIALALRGARKLVRGLREELTEEERYREEVLARNKWRDEMIRRGVARYDWRTGKCDWGEPPKEGQSRY